MCNVRVCDCVCVCVFVRVNVCVCVCGSAHTERVWDHGCYINGYFESTLEENEPFNAEGFHPVLGEAHSQQ